MTTTMTIGQLSKNLSRAAREASKARKQKAKEQEDYEASLHQWNRFGGECRDCGVSCYEPHDAICSVPVKEKRGYGTSQCGGLGNNNV